MLASASRAERLPALGSVAEPPTAVRYAAKLVFQNWRYVLRGRQGNLGPRHQTSPSFSY